MYMYQAEDLSRVSISFLGLMITHPREKKISKEKKLESKLSFSVVFLL